MPRVSVIIPTYNRKVLVQEAVESVCRQTFRDFEILVIDDGSTDGTAQEIVAIKDNRIRYFRKENGGVSSARNLGLREAKGAYIAFLDSDDLYVPDYLETMVSSLEKAPEYGVAYASVTMEHPDGSRQERMNDKYAYSGWIVRSLFSRFFVYCQAGLIRRELLDGFFFDETLELAEDQDFFLRLSTRTPFLFVPQTFVIRRTQTESLSRQGGKGRVHLDNLKVPERFYFEYGGSDWIPRRQAMRILSRKYRKTGFKLLQESRKTEGLQCLKKAIQYNKWSLLSVMLGRLRFRTSLFGLF
ncbi:MAG TPA: glycosyltransferase family A protein [Anaerohalosphaeraceae bacterium]|nr:glycosyltransferase family A protein [Anaerohalosphaeraceae bacterium]